MPGLEHLVGEGRIAELDAAAEELYDSLAEHGLVAEFDSLEENGYICSAESPRAWTDVYDWIGGIMFATGIKTTPAQSMEIRYVAAHMEARMRDDGLVGEG